MRAVSKNLEGIWWNMYISRWCVCWHILSRLSQLCYDSHRLPWNCVNYTHRDPNTHIVILSPRPLEIYIRPSHGVCIDNRRNYFYNDYFFSALSTRALSLSWILRERELSEEFALTRKNIPPQLGIWFRSESDSMQVILCQDRTSHLL